MSNRTILVVKREDPVSTMIARDTRKRIAEATGLDDYLKRLNRWANEAVRRAP